MAHTEFEPLELVNYQQSGAVHQIEKSLRDSETQASLVIVASNLKNQTIIFDTVWAAKRDSDEFLKQKHIFHGQIKITNCICDRRIQTKKNRNKEYLFK